MTNVIGFKAMDIGHIKTRHHQCEVDGEEDVDGEGEATGRLRQATRTCDGCASAVGTSSNKNYIAISS